MSLLVGFLLINKPSGISSFGCIGRLKRLLPPKTIIGHAGTLDVFAHGLLIVGIGRAATRFMNSILALDKKYTFRAKLHELTDTLDYTGTPIQGTETFMCSAAGGVKPIITRAQLKHAIQTLGESYLQVPPIYSALKYKGEPLYELARTKQLLPSELAAIAYEKARAATLHHLEIVSFDYPFFTCTAHVSKGTYIRSLANDIAQQLGSTATTYELQRTAIGRLTLDQAHALDTLGSLEQVMRTLISLDELAKLLEIEPLHMIKQHHMHDMNRNNNAMTISYEEFEKVELRVGTITKAEPFLRAKNPSYKVWVDFGTTIGIKQTSAQVTVHYTPESLVGRLVIGCVNLGTKNIAGFVSEFLLVGFADEHGAIRLAAIDGIVPNGQKLM